jgi:hypothetical protein
MQILSTRSKVGLRRFYESFNSNKRYKSYVFDSQAFMLSIRGFDLSQGNDMNDQTLRIHEKNI